MRSGTRTQTSRSATWWRKLMLAAGLILLSVTAAPALSLDDIGRGLDRVLGEISAPFEKVGPVSTVPTAAEAASAAPVEKESSLWDKLFGGLETSWEKKAGAEGYEYFKKKPGFYKDQRMYDQLGRVARRLVPTVERQDLTYRFQIIDSDEINAFALPGGYVFVTKGLMKSVGSDDELAGVVAHELGHIVKKHSLRQAEKAGIMTLLVALMGVKDETERYQKVAALGAFFAQMKFSRDDEFEADKKAVKYTINAGYDPNGLITFFNKINRDSKLSKITKIFSTHPPTNDRIAAVQGEIKRYNWKPAVTTTARVPATANNPSAPTTPTNPTTSPTPGTQTNPSVYVPNVDNVTLEQAYRNYAAAKARYENLLTAGAPYDDLMKAFNAYQYWQKVYFALKSRAN